MAPFLQEVFNNLPSDGRSVFLRRYAATAGEEGRPVSDGLTKSILSVAANADEPEETRHWAFAAVQTLGNPFSAIAVAPAMLQIPRASVAIPDFYLARKVGEEGIYGGAYERAGKRWNLFFDTEQLRDASGKISEKTFDGMVSYLDGRQTLRGHRVFHVQNPLEYESKLNDAFTDGSIEGKWFILPVEAVSGQDINDKTMRPDHNLIELINIGDLAGTLKNVGCMLTSSFHPGCRGPVRIAAVVGGVQGGLIYEYEAASCGSVRLGRVVKLTR